MHIASICIIFWHSVFMFLNYKKGANNSAIQCAIPTILPPLCMILRE